MDIIDMDSLDTDPEGSPNDGEQTEMSVFLESEAGKVRDWVGAPAAQSAISEVTHHEAIYQQGHATIFNVPFQYCLCGESNDCSEFDITNTKNNPWEKFSETPTHSTSKSVLSFDQGRWDHLNYVCQIFIHRMFYVNHLTDYLSASIWNSTVNISGGQGNCIAKDLYVEFQHNNLKDEAEIALFLFLMKWHCIYKCNYRR